MLDQLSKLPDDPILGLSQRFHADPNPDKVLLGVGVYQDEEGQTPILQAVQEAQKILLEQETSKAYLSPKGVPGFVEGMLNLLLLDETDTTHPHLSRDCIAALQTPGGCGALRLLAEVLQRAKKETSTHPTIWLSNPTWANHPPLMTQAGLDKIQFYPYYLDTMSESPGQVSFHALLDCLTNQVQKGDVVLLQACCHNPTGADLTKEQWDQVWQASNQVGWIPFFDVAYQGLGKGGLDDDVYGLRLFARNLVASNDDDERVVLVAASCSKNFGLYRERVGLAAVLASTPSTAMTVQSQLQDISRGSYSMPPSHGAFCVDIILKTPHLKTMWQDELAAMRRRLQDLRKLLVQELDQAQQEQSSTRLTTKRNFDFVHQHHQGLYSLTGLSVDQIQRLRTDHSVYMVNSSRINLAGINRKNVGYVAKAIATVLVES